MRPGILALLALSGCGDSGPALPAIHGGYGVAREHFVARSVVALTLADGQRICSGTFVGHGTVLTAAHCIVPYHDRPLFVEFRGLGGATPLAIVESRYHSGYVGGSVEWSTSPTIPYHDVAVSFFDEPPPDEVWAALPSFEGPPPSSLLLAGYGETGDWDYRGESPRAVEVRAAPEFPGTSILCLMGGNRENCEALPRTHAGACSGDSGGAVFDGLGNLWGIISYIDESCEQGITFGVLLAQYRSWLEANSGLEFATGHARERVEEQAVRVFHEGVPQSTIDFSLLGPFATVAGWPGFLCADFRDGRDASVWYEISTGMGHATEFRGPCASWAR